MCPSKIGTLGKEGKIGTLQGCFRNQLHGMVNVPIWLTTPHLHLHKGDLDFR